MDALHMASTSKKIHQIAQSNAQQLLEAFGLGFVGISVVEDADNPILMWNYAAGNTNDRYKKILLPVNIGALGKVFQYKSAVLAGRVEDDIAHADLFQYPIVAAEGLVGFFAFPLLDNFQNVRVIVICGWRTTYLLDDEKMLLIQNQIAQSFGLAISKEPVLRLHNNESTSLYGHLSQRLLQAQEMERKRIAQDLHDGIAQEILVSQIALRQLKYLPQEQWPEHIERVTKQLRMIMSHLSEVAHGLRPAALDELGLGSAITSYCNHVERAFGVHVECQIDLGAIVNPDVEIALYRIFQEALSNACKYSRSENIEVILSIDGDKIELSIRDFGVGFNLEEPCVKGGGLGLEGMKERAKSIHAHLSIDTNLGEGTLVRVCV